MVKHLFFNTQIETRNKAATKTCQARLICTAKVAEQLQLLNLGSEIGEGVGNTMHNLKSGKK
jgi:hypothetical protein